MDETIRMEFLKRLAQAGDGASAKVVAQEMGLQRQDAEDLSVSLMTGGLLEMVSLSGAVRLTPAGRNMVQGASAAASGQDDLPSLLAEIAAAGDLGLGPVEAIDLASDTACLAAHLRRSRPLEPVRRACLAAISDGLEKARAPLAQSFLLRVEAFRKK